MFRHFRFLRISDRILYFFMILSTVFGIAVDPLTFQPKMHPTVTVGLETVFLLQTQLLCQGGVFLRPAQTLYMIVVAASGHAKEPAHSRYGILCLMTIDDLVFELRLHILSMSERKSRSN